MDVWCHGEPFGIVSSVPTPCVTLTTLIIMPSAMISLISTLKLLRYRELLLNSGVDVLANWNYSLKFFILCCCLEVIFTIVFSVDDVSSPALVVGVALHSLAWVLLGLSAVLSAAATRHRMAIDASSWGFFLVDMCGIGLLAVAQYTERRSIQNLIAAICSFAVSLMVISFGIYSSSLDGRGSYKRVKKDNDSITGQICGWCSAFWGAITGARDSRYSFESSEENRRSFWSLHSDTKSWWGSSNSEHDDPHDPLLSEEQRVGLMGAISTRQPFTFDEDIEGNTHQRKEPKDNKLYFENGNTCGYENNQIVSLEAEGMTDVLQRALDRRHIKLPHIGGANGIASLTGKDSFNDDVYLVPGLAPNFGGGTMQEFSVIIHRWALLRERGRASVDAADSGPSAVTPPLFLSGGADATQLAGEAVIDLESGGSIHESYQRQQQRRKGRTRSSSGDEILLASAQSSTAQVEFEICIRGGPCPEMEWWGRSKGMQPSLSKWTVWRTALQIEDLHKDMIGLYGDLAPRRPKLHTARVFRLSQLVNERGGGSPSVNKAVSPDRVSPKVQEGGTLSPSHSHGNLSEEASVSREEIAADMRAIAGYLRSMLNQPTLHCSELFQFLEVPQHLLGSFRSPATKNYDACAPLSKTSPSAFASAEQHANMKLASSEASSGSNQLASESTPMDDTGGDRSDGNSDEPAGGEWNSQQDERWRKIYMNLRKGLKPREHLRRCFVFEGVVTGEDVVRWLTTKGLIGSIKEAESIGEGLVGVGRLVPICLGMNSSSDQIFASRDPAPMSFDAINSIEPAGSEGDGRVVVGSELTQKFRNSPTYIYSYPGPTKQGPSKTKPLYTLFGDVISVSITNMIKRGNVQTENDYISVNEYLKSPSFEMSDSGSLKSEPLIGIRSPSPTLSSAGSVTSPKSPPEDSCSSAATDEGFSDSGDGFIEYEILCRNSNEEWKVFRRYKEFVALNRLLHRSGIRPKEPLPSPLLGKLLQHNKNKRLEERRTQLQSYLKSAITAVVQANIARLTSAATAKPEGAGAAVGIALFNSKSSLNEVEKAMISLAKFLDKEFDKLRFVQKSST